MGGMGQGESPALFESSLKSKYCLCEVAEVLIAEALPFSAYAGEQGVPKTS